MPTPGVLWLAFERPPHPDAVSFPAGEDDARLAIELLEAPYPRRLHLAEQLRNFLAVQRQRPVRDRQRVPCRRPSGWYQLVPWRLAKWLAMVLPATDGIAARTAGRIRQWLAADSSPRIVNPQS